MRPYDDAYGFASGITADKAAHMRGVAEKMRNMALERGWGAQRASDMYVLGLLHDVGYAVDRTCHSEAGAELLARNGYRYADEVLHHGRPVDDPSDELMLLWEADLTTDHEGCDVSIAERLVDIGSRYGFDSRQYRNAAAVAEKVLKTR